MKQYILNLFADKPFDGLPMALIKLDKEYDDYLLHQVAKENNLALTCFILEKDGKYNLKSYSPFAYVELESKGALGAFYILNKYYNVNKNEITFITKEGNVTVYGDKDYLKIKLPEIILNEGIVDKQIIECQGARPGKVFNDKDVLCIYNSEATIRHLKPGVNKVRKLLGRLLTISSVNKGSDVLSRSFGIISGEDEEPLSLLTCSYLAAYWSKELNKNEISLNHYFKNGFSEVLLLKENDDIFLKTKIWEYGISDINL